MYIREPFAKGKGSKHPGVALKCSHFGCVLSLSLAKARQGLPRSAQELNYGLFDRKTTFDRTAPDRLGNHFLFLLDVCLEI